MSDPRDRYTFSNQSSIPKPVYEVICSLLCNWDKTSDATHAYLSAFSDDATLDLPPNKSTGHDAIRTLRNSLIHPVKGPAVGVAHTFHRAYVQYGHVNDGSEKVGGNGELNVCMNGSVDYTVRGGNVATQDFATLFDLVPVQGGEGEYKIRYAKIYTDNAPLMAAIMEIGPLESK